MAKKDRSPKLDRRRFLTAAAVAGASGAVSSGKAGAATAGTTEAPARLPSALPPNAHVAAAEAGAPDVPPYASEGRPGSDFMVDVIKTLNIKYLPANPASSYRAIHESLINYGKNSMPEFLTCTHEECGVGIAHGYAKITNKPLMTLCHGTVGLMHATMNVYNAFCDRMPVVILAGNDLDAAHRPPGVPTVHSAQDINAIVRDYTKWDDTPVSAQHFAQSFVRAYQIATTPPYAPVVLSLDDGLATEPVRDFGQKLYIPKFVPTAPPAGEAGAVREAARLLINAERPVIVADRAVNTQRGMNFLVQLAELLQAPMVRERGRLNFPTTHYLGRPASVIAQADVVLGLELTDYWATVNKFVDNNAEGVGTITSTIKLGTKLISIGTLQLMTKANYQEFQRFQSVDVPIAGDVEATLPALIEAVKYALTDDRKNMIGQRGEATRKDHEKGRDATRQAAAIAWDASPISTARLCAEIYAQIKDLDWSLVPSSGDVSGWPLRLWPMDKPYHWTGTSGGYGVGWGCPASVGGALANRDEGRFSVAIQSDGDLMYAPGALWTAARHKIPLLSVMHNNRGYHQEVMHVQRLSNFRNRVANLGNDLGPVGTSIMNPDIEYHKLAQSMGWWAKGPITDPAELGPAIKEAVAVVKSGQPALVNVWTQPR
ncbi:MAG TPA: thiamine pyrophosphate-dependent enzyme [Xanthobacteraceae bacterium]|nr:thiamine pyrophosphate-dependent enzyme [Xanthobacteraceae bacterium]